MRMTLEAIEWPKGIPPTGVIPPPFLGAKPETE
jgi:hypothetical protein